MTDVKFYVVTEENYEEFKEKFMKTNNDFVFYVVSVHDYENLALNMSELFRYIKQQKEIKLLSCCRRDHPYHSLRGERCS